MLQIIKKYDRSIKEINLYHKYDRTIRENLHYHKYSLRSVFVSQYLFLSICYIPVVKGLEIFTGVNFLGNDTLVNLDFNLWVTKSMSKCLVKLILGIHPI